MEVYRSTIDSNCMMPRILLEEKAKEAKLNQKLGRMIYANQLKFGFRGLARVEQYSIRF